MRNLTERLNEALEKADEYVVVLTGGSVGTTNNYAVSGQHATLYRIDDNKFVGTAEECKKYVSEHNKSLSPTEKKYYHMRYKAIPLTSLKYSNMKKLSETDKDKLRDGVNPIPD
jgi:hypothetical protein